MGPHRLATGRDAGRRYPTSRLRAAARATKGARDAASRASSRQRGTRLVARSMTARLPSPLRDAKRRSIGLPAPSRPIDAGPSRRARSILPVCQIGATQGCVIGSLGLAPRGETGMRSGLRNPKPQLPPQLYAAGLFHDATGAKSSGRRKRRKPRARRPAGDAFDPSRRRDGRRRDGAFLGNTSSARRKIPMAMKPRRGPFPFLSRHRRIFRDRGRAAVCRLTP